MTRAELVAMFCTSPHANGRMKQMQLVNGLERYLRVHGPYLPVAEAARRCEVDPRTIARWRKALREAS
jgi:hypothetical protein